MQILPSKQLSLVGEDVRGGSGGIQAVEINGTRFGILFGYNCRTVNKHLSELYKELYGACDLICQDSRSSRTA